MAFREDEEVNSNSENFSIKEWEEAYEVLLQEFEKIKKENKILKKKINEVLHDTSVSEKCEEFK